MISETYIKKQSNLIVLFIALILTVYYCFDLFLLRNNSFVIAHDNLDSSVIFYKVIAESGMLFSRYDAIIPNFLSGLPRLVFPSEFNIITMSYYLLNPFDAYVFNQVLMRIVAFVGMYFLLTRYIIKDEFLFLKIIIILLSYSFAVLPYWPLGGASVAGQPLLLFAFLNIKSRIDSKNDWLIIIFFAFYSSLILAGIFVLFVLCCIFVYDWVKNKSFNIKYFIAIAFLSILYIGIEYRLFLNLIDPIFISHRTEFVADKYTFTNTIERITDIFYYGQYHAHSKHTNFILPILFAYSCFLILPKKVVTSFSIFISCIVLYDASLLSKYFELYIWNNYFLGSELIFIIVILLILTLKRDFIIGSILFIILLISSFYGVWSYEPFVEFRMQIELLKIVQFDRFYFLFATMWFLIFSLLAKGIIYKYKFIGFILVLIILVNQICLSFENKHFAKGTPTTFEHYYNTELFNEIDAFIGKDKSTYRVLTNSGIQVAPVIYNGFYTLEGYISNYPLTYKHKFRKVIEKNLEISLQNKNYFDNWGSRCEIKTSSPYQINFKEAKLLGAKYFFSGTEYTDALYGDEKEFGLKYLKMFSNKYLTLYLYEII